MIQVIIADDHELIRSGLARLIERETDIILAAEASDAAGAIELLSARPCDVLILDISLPDRNGIEVLKEVIRRYPHLAVLILSIHPEDQYALRALNAGAAGYITKDNASTEFIRAIRKVAGGGRYVGEQTAERMAATLTDHKPVAPHELLSDREHQILALLGEGKSARTIADELHLSFHTVHTYRRRIMEKLELESTSQLVRYALEKEIT